MDYSNKWPYWKALRKQVLEQDNYTCQDCGTTKRKLYIHHIKTVKNKGRNTTDNLKAVCYDCHVKYHPHLQNQKESEFQEKSDLEKLLTQRDQRLNEYKRKLKRSE